MTAAIAPQAAPDLRLPRPPAELVQDALDSLEVGDLVFHDLAFATPLVTDLVARVVAEAPAGARVLLVGPQAALGQALVLAGYRLDLLRYGDGYLPDDLADHVVAEVDAEALAAGRLPVTHQYDVILLPMLVEHLRENPKLVLRTLKSHLLAHGRLIIATANLGRLGSRLRALLGRSFLPDWKSAPQHRPGGWPLAPVYRFYTAGELTTWAREAGYAVADCTRLDGDQTYWAPLPLTVPQYLIAVTKARVKGAAPGLRDHLVLTLRHEEQDELLPPLAPFDETNPAAHPFVSVVLPTRNRAHLLPDALDGLLAQDYPADRWELVLINDGSTDATADVIAGYADRFPCRVVTDNTGGIGAAAARNAGMRLAQGDIVAHTDDDTHCPPGWLRAGAQGFERDVAFVAGPVYPDPRDRMTFFSWVMNQPTDNGTYPTSNIFYRRLAVLEAGGFDEAFGVNLLGRPVWGWDSDLAWRLIRRGYQRRFRGEAYLHSHIFNLGPRRWLMEGWRASMLPGVIRQVPELRGTLLKGNLFLTANSAGFELGVVATLLALVTRRWRLLLLWGPWLRLALQYARGDWFPPARWAKLAAKVPFFFAAHVVYVAALVWGSIKARYPVL